MTITRRYHARSRGFTLIEAVCAIVVIALMGTVVASMIHRAGSTFTGAAIRAQATADVNAAMDTIYRRLRAISAKAGTSPAAPSISSITASSITFDTNCTLSLSNGTLAFADAGGAAQTLLTNTTSFVIEPLDAANAALTVPLSGSGCDAVQRIRVTIGVTRSGETATLRTTVFIRSLFTGAAP